ncbi:MAG: ABC transporter ATP-binding protein [bacterium]
MEHLLTVQNTSYFYGEKKALSEISFDVKKGETFGLIGPDGAGKTTLIRLFCGLLQPSSGSCSVLGLDTVKEKYRLIPKIGYLSQKFSLYTDMTVSENIDFFATIHRVPNFKSRKEELLEFTGLLNFKKRLAGALSGGMKQKLALSCTLIHTPEIIFLDEPTNGVDPVARKEFWTILKEIASTGVSIIISTPYIEEAERCDRVGLMNEGVLIACDTPANVKSMFPFKLYEILSEDIRKAKKVLEESKRFDFVQIFGSTIHTGIEKNRDDKFLKEIFKTEEKVKIREIKPTLEDVFIAILENGEQL